MRRIRLRSLQLSVASTFLGTIVGILSLAAPRDGIAAPGAAASAEQLAWRFTPDETLNYRMVQHMQMTMDMGDAGPIQSETKQDFDMSWKVLSVDSDGVATISQKIDRLRMDMTMGGGQTMNYDSQSTAPPQGAAAMIAPVMKTLTKTPFDFRMTPRGKVVDVTVPDELIAALKASPGAAMMGEMLTQEGFRQMIEKGSPVLPEDVTNSGPWSTEIKIANAKTGTVKVKTTYRYNGSREVDGRTLEVIEPTLEMSFGEGADSAESKIQVVNQESTGEILFDRDAGRLDSSRLKMTMEMHVTEKGQEFTLHTDQTVDMKYEPPTEN